MRVLDAKTHQGQEEAREGCIEHPTAASSECINRTKFGKAAEIPGHEDVNGKAWKDETGGEEGKGEEGMRRRKRGEDIFERAAPQIQSNNPISRCVQWRNTTTPVCPN